MSPGVEPDLHHHNPAGWWREPPHEIGRYSQAIPEYSHGWRLNVANLVAKLPMHTWEVTPGNKPPKIPQNSHLNGV